MDVSSVGLPGSFNKPYMKTSIFLACVAPLLIAACSTVPSLESLQKQKPPAFALPMQTPAGCKPVPSPQRDIQLNGFYQAGTSTVVDPARMAAWKAAIKPFDDWLGGAYRYADEYVGKGNAEAGRCAVAFLDVWARGDAMLGSLRADDQGRAKSFYTQQDYLTGATVVYMKVRPVATPEQEARILWWFSQLAARVEDFWRPGRNDFGQNSANGLYRNNHAAWTAVGVMNTGLFTGNPEAIRWARSIFNEQLATVDANGVLPREIIRKQLAYHYHAYALVPLTYMAVASRQLGEDWTMDPRLRRAQTLTARATLDQNVIAKYAGQPQREDVGNEDHNWIWYGLLDDNDELRVMTRAVVTKIPTLMQLGGDSSLARRALLRKTARQATSE